MPEQLVLETAVVDKFSAPLKKLRSDLQNIKPPKAVEDVHRSFDKFRQSVEQASKFVTGGFNQAVSGLGVSSLASIASIGGMAAAVKKLASNAIEMRQFERETGVAADTLRRFKAIAGEFGADKDAFGPAIKSFHEKLYDFKKRGDPGAFSELLNAGLGDLVGRFRSEGITETLNDVLNEAAKNADSGPDGAERAKRILEASGLGSFTRLVLKGRKALQDALRNAPVDIVPADAEQRAIEFERAYSRIEKGLESLARKATSAFVEPVTEGLKLTEKLIERLPDAAEAVKKAIPGDMWENTKREFGIGKGDGKSQYEGGREDERNRVPGLDKQDWRELFKKSTAEGVFEGLEQFQRLRASGGFGVPNLCAAETKGPGRMAARGPGESTREATKDDSIAVAVSPFTSSAP